MFAEQRGSTQTILTFIVGVLALAALLVFYGPEEPQQPERPAAEEPPIPKDIPTTAEEGRPNDSAETAALTRGFPGAAQVVYGTADNPPEGLPEDLRKALQNPNPELPPDMQAQLNAPPPELPADLRRQLENQPTKLPDDLQRQLEMPPPPIPEDIRRALETPPREVSIDEVNTPIDAR